MGNEIASKLQDIFGIGINVQTEVKLEGWPASVAMIMLCFSGVAIYVIKEMGQTKRTSDSSNVS